MEHADLFLGSTCSGEHLFEVQVAHSVVSGPTLAAPFILLALTPTNPSPKPVPVLTVSSVWFEIASMAYSLFSTIRRAAPRLNKKVGSVDVNAQKHDINVFCVSHTAC